MILPIIGKLETNLKLFYVIVFQRTSIYSTKMTTVGRPSKSKIFRRVRYNKKKGKRHNNPFQPLYTTAVDVNINDEYAMVSHSP